MIGPGFSTVDPITGTRTLVIKGSVETAAKGWELEVHCPPGTPSSIKEHFHVSWTETFEIVAGTARYKLDGEEYTLDSGERVIMHRGLPHVHPWNAGAGEMIYRQINQFDNASPDAIQDVIGVFATINGLAREGKIRKDGLPKNPLQFAATIRTLNKYDGYDATVPVALQRFIAATLGRLAEVLGYRGVYPRYVESAKDLVQE